MRTKILIPLFLLLIVSSILAAKVQTSWWDVYYKYAYMLVEKYRIGMETIISFTNEKGKDSTKLSSIKGEFLSANAELKTACDNEDKTAIETTILKMKDIVKRFKEEARIQLVGFGIEALSRINAAWEANETYFNSLLDDARNLHKQRNTEIYDWAVQKGEEAIQKLEEYGKDATLAKAKLTEIKAKRENFVNSMSQAIASCYGVPQRVLVCPSGLVSGDCLTKVQSYCNLRDEIKSDFNELRDLVYQAAGLK